MLKGAHTGANSSPVGGGGVLGTRDTTRGYSSVGAVQPAHKFLEHMASELMNNNHGWFPPPLPWLSTLMPEAR